MSDKLRKGYVRISCGRNNKERREDTYMGLLEKIFGDLNAKEVKKVEKIVDVIESYN